MKCEKCGAEIVEDASFCTSCGAPVAGGKGEPAADEASDSMKCAKCGADLDPSFAFCVQCGAPVAQAGATPDEDVTQVLKAAAPAAAAATVAVSPDANKTMDMLYNNQTTELPNLPQPISNQAGYAQPAPQYAPPVYQAPVAAPAKQRSNTPLIIAVAVAAAAIAFIVAFFVMHGGIGGDDQAQTETETVAATQDDGKSGDNITIIVPGNGSSGSSSTGSTNVQPSSGSSSGDYVIPYSSSSYVSASDLSGLSYWDLRVARNEIYARHGRGFKDSALQSYFNSKSWYTYQYSADSFPDSILNAVEKKNVETIKSYEKSVGSPYV